MTEVGGDLAGGRSHQLEEVGPLDPRRAPHRAGGEIDSSELEHQLVAAAGVDAPLEECGGTGLARGGSDGPVGVLSPLTVHQLEHAEGAHDLEAGNAGEVGGEHVADGPG